MKSVVATTLTWMTQVNPISEVKEGQPQLVHGLDTSKEDMGYYAKAGNSKPHLFISCLENPLGLPEVSCNMTVLLSPAATIRENNRISFCLYP